MIKYILLFFLSYSSKSLFAQKVNKVFIDPDNARGGTISQYFNTFRFIPLETTKESLFGKIDQLAVTQTHFIVLDQQTKSILFFRKDGSFDFKIRPRQADHYYDYFTIDRRKSELLVQTAIHEISIYDLKGNFLKKVNLGKNINSLDWLQNGHIIYQLEQGAPSENSPKVKYNIAYSGDYLKSARFALPYDPRFGLSELNQYMNSLNKSEDPENVFFSLPGDYNVYQLKDYTHIIHYQFIFPLKYSLPNNFSADSTYAQKRAKYVYFNAASKGKFESIENIFKPKENLLLFSLRNVGYLTNNWTYLYNLKTGLLLSLGKVTGDSLSSYLPFASPQFGETMVVYKNHHLYSSIASSTLFSIKEHKEKSHNFGSVLNRYFAHENRRSNPVLMEAKLKENL